jgi:hypothetical protein
MPRRLPSPKAVPWALLLEAISITRDRWREGLSQRDRARLNALVRKSRGRRGNLSRRERDEVRELLGKVDFKAIGQDIMSARSSRRRRHR